MKRQKRSKILKIRYGYQTNCSSGMWALYYLFLGGITLLGFTVGSVFLSVFLKTKLKSKLEDSKCEFDESTI
ncbi:MAG: hypothetical protein ACTSQE_06395 [Candidatus Heimdallarchaeaceae archaeon]